MKNYKKLVAALVSLCVISSCLTTSVAASSNIPACDWGSSADSDGNKMIYTSVYGTVLTLDGEYVSNDTFVEVVVQNKEVYFCFGSEDGYWVNPFGQNVKINAFCSLSETGLKEMSLPLYSYADSEYMIVGEESASVPNSTLLMNEWNLDGNVELFVSMPLWNGARNQVLYFNINSTNSDFAELLVSKPDSNTQVQSTYYTNTEVVSICQGYVDRLNDVIPYAQQLYESINNENPLAGFISGGLAFSFGMEPFGNFLDAKYAYDQLKPDKMTSEQYSLYLSTKSNVNSTGLGQIMAVIDFLIASGLLS